MKSKAKLAKASQTALYAAWDGERTLEGPYSITRIEADLNKAQDDPKSRQGQFQKARQLYAHQWFIRSVIQLRFAFYHYKMRFLDEKGKATPAVKKWELNNRAMSRRYARDAWIEYLIQDSAVGIWRKQGGKPPVVFPVENCRYEDFFGEEMLKITHDVTQERVELVGGFNRAEKETILKMRGDGLVLKHNDKSLDFNVLKRERTGCGLGVPAITPMFMTAAALNSLDVGNASVLGAMREIFEQHLMGHEIKSGIHAGSKANFWNKTRAASFQDAVKGKSGHYKASTNFDHAVRQAANWVDPKHLDFKRWESGIQKMCIWSMPLGHMLLGKSVNPFLLPMLKQQAETDREAMAAHLATVFVEGMGAPPGLQIKWSNRCFTDPRAAATMLTAGLASGPVSQTTFQQENDLDPDEERANKAAEAELPEEQTMPLYDGAHGKPDKDNGRPPGSKKGDGK